MAETLRRPRSEARRPPLVAVAVALLPALTGSVILALVIARAVPLLG